MGLFKRVRIQLVLTNAIVFSVILILICGILYLFTRERTFQQLDRELTLAARPIERMAETPASARSAFPMNPPDFTYGRGKEIAPNPRFGQLPTTFLIWSNQKTLVRQLPEGTFSQKEFPVFQKDLGQTKPYTLSVEGHEFRVLNVRIPSHSQNLLPGGGVVQVVRNIDDSLRQLRNLGWLLVITTGLGLLFSTLAGLFLAGRALVPINRAWERQQKFVSDASHELRTPLAVIQAQAELMLRHPDNTIEQEASGVGSIYEEARRMSKLVESLLTLARADSNQAELNIQTVSLTAMFASVNDIFTLLSSQNDLRLKLSVEDGVEVQGDEDRLRQLILILFDNAVKYTPAGGEIHITCSQHGNGTEIEVRDTGPGIPQNDLPFIFERFYRGDKARSRATGGAGLGLSIAQWIVQAHHGKITAQSEVGKGTTFRVSLPLRAT